MLHPMSRLPLLLLGLLVCLPACRIATLLPKGPVISPYERARTWVGAASSGATYTGPAEVSFPVLPVMVWAAAYDLDLVLVGRRDDDWDMHEYAVMRTPAGPLWLAKDTRMGTLDQVVVADIDDIDRFMPELPVLRKQAKVEVDDRSTAERIDVTLRYENFDGRPVVVGYRGDPPPAQPNPKRNGSAMGHSRNLVLAVLDLSHQRFADKATLTIDERDMGIRRIGGAVPFRMALVQTQGGFGTARMRQAPMRADDAPPPSEPNVVEVELGDVTTLAPPPVPRTDTAFLTTHWLPSGGEATVDWVISEEPGAVVAKQVQPVRTLEYRWHADGESLELASMRIWQWDRPVPTLAVELTPALPDLRRRFEGRHRSRYVIDINGQYNHAVGWLEAWWEADGPRVELRPDAPWWTRDRPMRTVIRYADGAADIAIERLPTDEPTGCGGKLKSCVQVPGR